MRLCDVQLDSTIIVLPISSHQGIQLVQHAKLHGVTICLLVRQRVPIGLDDEHRIDKGTQDLNLKSLVIALIALQQLQRVMLPFKDQDLLLLEGAMLLGGQGLLQEEVELGNRLLIEEGQGVVHSAQMVLDLFKRKRKIYMYSLALEDGSHFH